MFQVGKGDIDVLADVGRCWHGRQHVIRIVGIGIVDIFGHVGMLAPPPLY